MFNYDFARHYFLNVLTVQNVRAFRFLNVNKIRLGGIVKFQRSHYELALSSTVCDSTDDLVCNLLGQDLLDTVVIESTAFCLDAAQVQFRLLASFEDELFFGDDAGKVS